VHFTDDAGRHITIDAIYSSRTYAGVLEGVPSEALNAKIVERARKSVASLWGHRALYLDVPTPMPTSDDGFSTLPEWTHRAWLTSSPFETSALQSELVLVWFADEQPRLSACQLVRAALRSLDWEAHALDVDL
jgi:hypothetical protein